MPEPIRHALVRKGPRFFLGEDGEEMFEFVLDGSNRIGPAPATDDDRAGHEEAYLAFIAGEESEPESPLKPPFTMDEPRKPVGPENIPPGMGEHWPACGVHFDPPKACDCNAQAFGHLKAEGEAAPRRGRKG